MSDDHIVSDTVLVVSIEQTRHRREAAAGIRRGATRLAQRLRAERPPDGLSANKLSVLSHLYRHGPSTPGEIAAAEHQHPQSLTRVFAELELAGLVSRSPSERDGRAAVLNLQPAGQEALSRDMGERDARLAHALDKLTAAEVDLLTIAAALMEQLADLPAVDPAVERETA
jgi:DNA-binding MarR family transcriptional regulator